MALRVNNSNNVKIYSVSSSSRTAIPEWLARKRKKDLKYDQDWSHRVELIQDFCFPEASNRIKRTKDGRYIIATGVYKPQIRVYDLAEMSMKFERHNDAENVQIEVLSDDWRKMVLLQADRSVEFHTQTGLHYRTRIPCFGRDMKYDYPSCDLVLVGASSDVYRLNLEQGRFMNPIVTESPAINTLSINPANQLWGFAGEDGYLELYDPRTKNRLTRFYAGYTQDTDVACELTAMRFFDDGLTYGVGTSSGQVLLYDLRSRQPIITKQHATEEKIISIDCHSSGKIISADKKSIRLWEKESAKNFCTYEPEHDLNDTLIFDNTGMIMTANEGAFMNVMFVPSLGPAPKWCSFLDNLTEELEENVNKTPYDDYKFVTKKELTNLGLDHLIGTNVLKAYMHGFFIDIRLYEKARSIANPFAFEDYKKKLVREKLEKERQSRISSNSRLPKINRALAEKLLGDKGPNEEGKVENPVADDRFKELFTDPLFQIDEEDAEFIKFNTRSKSQKKKQKEEDSDSHAEVEGIRSSDDESVYGDTSTRPVKSFETVTRRSRGKFEWNERPNTSLKKKQFGDKTFGERVQKAQKVKKNAGDKNREFTRSGAMAMSFKVSSKRRNCQLLLINSNAAPKEIAVTATSNSVDNQGQCGVIPDEKTASCTYVKQNCTNLATGRLNYVEFVYCSQERSAAIVGLFFYLMFLFVFVGTAASDYFSPNVASVANILKLPNEVAGVTLLAFGNAAGDLVGNLVSINALGTATLAVSELFGAGIITTGFVSGLIALIGRNEGAKLHAMSVARDMVFYMLGLLVMLGVVVGGRISWWQGVLMLFLYLVYIIVVVAMGSKRIMRRVNWLINKFRRFQGELPQPQEELEFPAIFVETPDGDIQMHYNPTHDQETSVTSTKPALVTETLILPSESSCEDLLQVPDGSPNVDISRSKLRGRSRSIDLGKPTRANSTKRAKRQPSADAAILEERRDIKPSLSVGTYTSRNSSKSSFLNSPISARTQLDFTSANIVNLNLQEKLLSKMRVTSLSSALELWDAWRTINKPDSSDSEESLHQELPNPAHGTAVFDFAQSELFDETTGISVMIKCDMCPTCFKSASSGPRIQYRLFHTFIDHCLPAVRLWRMESWLSRFVSIVNALPIITLSLTVPVYASFEEETAEELATPSAIVTSPTNFRCEYGESKLIDWKHRYIVCIQLFLLPLSICFGINVHLNLLPNTDFPVWSLCLIIGAILSASVAFISRKAKRIVHISYKKGTCDNMECVHCMSRRKLAIRTLFSSAYWNSLDYCKATAFVGFVTGLLWIYVLTTEVVSVLKTLGRALNISEAIMGVTVFALGNSIGDFVTNIMLARLGYYAMATAACWGAPMLNTLITIGIAGTFFQPAGHDLFVSSNPIIITSFVGLFFILLCNIFVLGFWFKFRLRRSFGLFLVVCGSLIMLLNVVIESIMI